MSLATFAQYGYTTTYTTTSTDTSGIAWAIFFPLLMVYLAVLVVMIVSLWKVFAKTGRPGWAAIVPVYNTWVIFEIVGYPGWWALLSLVPLVNFFPAVMMIIAYYKLAKLFGKSDGFAVCNVLFPIVTMPILAFGSSTFQGTPVATVPVGPQAPQSPTAVQQSAPVPQQAPAAPEAPQTQEQPQPPQTPQGPLIQ